MTSLRATSLARRERALALLGRYGVVLGLAALIAFGALRYDRFLGSFNVLSFLGYNAMFALVSLGMAFVIMTGGIDLSVGAVAALGSVVAAGLFPPACWMILHPGLPVLIAATGAAVLIVWRHRGNMERIRAGTERVFRFSK